MLGVTLVLNMFVREFSEAKPTMQTVVFVVVVKNRKSALTLKELPGSFDATSIVEVALDIGSGRKAKDWTAVPRISTPPLPPVPIVVFQRLAVTAASPAWRNSEVSAGAPESKLFEKEPIWACAEARVRTQSASAEKALRFISFTMADFLILKVVMRRGLLRVASHLPGW
jgi:hypothetical protein